MFPCPLPRSYKFTTVRRDIKIEDDGHGTCLLLAGRALQLQCQFEMSTQTGLNDFHQCR
jgi:hypothetical protein